MASGIDSMPGSLEVVDIEVSKGNSRSGETAVGVGSSSLKSADDVGWEVAEGIDMAMDAVVVFYG